MTLTPRQAEILNFIAEYTQTHGYAPTLEEIGGRFRLSSVATVHKHISQLAAKGYVRRQPNQRRAIKVLQPAVPAGRRVPLLGRVAAGRPIEPLSDREELELPEGWLGKGQTFALRVRGDSMIDEQIRDGDLVIVEERETARNGDMVIALVDGDSVTLKRYYRDGPQVRLEPANPLLSPLIRPEEQVRIQGIVIGVLRRF
jgi:repressor LexA